MNHVLRLTISSMFVGLFIVIGVTLGPVAMLSVLAAVGIFAAPIVVAVVRKRPKAAIESTPEPKELDPNDFDPRVNWPLVNQIEAEVGYPLSRHPDECRCSLCATQDPPKFASSSSMYVPLPYKPGAVVTPIKDNARAQVKDASIISQGARHRLRITYTDDTRQISNYATYQLAKEHMDAVMAYSSYSLRGLDMPALPKDQHAANNDCSCVSCNPTFGITPAESCIRNSCTCRYCDPDTAAPIMNCKLTGKAAPMLPSPFRDMPALHTYRDANIGSLTRAVLSCKLTEKQYHKLAKKYFDGDKSQARLVLSSALNDHYQKVAPMLIPAPPFKVGDVVETIDILNAREYPTHKSRQIHQVRKGFFFKVTKIENGYARADNWWYITDYLKLRSEPKAVSAPKFQIGDTVEANRGVVTLRSGETHGDKQREIMLGMTFEVRALSRGKNWFTPTPTGDSVWYLSDHFDKVEPEPENNFETTHGLP